MVKTKKKNIHLPLVITGYLLFSLLVVSVLASTTVPMSLMLFDPRVIHANVAVLMISLTLGAILPVFVAYIIGDHAVRSKSRVQHHFNGMVFALFAYFLMISLTVFIAVPHGILGDNPISRAVLINSIPSVGIVLVTTFFAVLHVRSRQAKKDILEYKPFSISFLVLVLLLPIWFVLNNLMTGNTGSYILTPLIAVLLPGVIAYVSIRRAKYSQYIKIVWSAVAIAVGYLALYVASQFVGALAQLLHDTATMEEQLLVSIVGVVLAVAGWLVYWVKQAKVLVTR